MQQRDSNGDALLLSPRIAGLPAGMRDGAGAGLKRLQRTAQSLFWLSRSRDEQRAPFSLREKLDAWRHGFLAESTRIYDFGRHGRSAYLDDFARRHRCKLINRYNEFFDHKLVMRSLLLGAGLAQPETIAVLVHGAILLHPFGAGRRYARRAELQRLLAEDGGRFIFKPEDGACGAEVFAVERRDGRLVRRRGTGWEPFDIESVGERCTLIERGIRQGPFWANLFPDSANTIRVLTMWMPGEDAPFIARAVQRIGTADTAPTDNWSSGGICAPIDLATGRMGAGRMHPVKGKRYEPGFGQHPDTGAQIQGAVLPFWDRVKAAALGAAATLPLNRYVGWDVYVDEAGTPIIGEGNGNSDVNLLQVHGGLLAEPRIRRFYRSVGVL